MTAAAPRMEAIMMRRLRVKTSCLCSVLLSRLFACERPNAVLLEWTHFETRGTADEVTDDSPLGCAVSSLSQTFSNFAPMFRYEFNDAGAGALGLPFTLGAYHGSELQYLF